MNLMWIVSNHVSAVIQYTRTHFNLTLLLIDVLYHTCLHCDFWNIKLSVTICSQLSISVFNFMHVHLLILHYFYFGVFLNLNFNFHRKVYCILLLAYCIFKHHIDYYSVLSVVKVVYILSSFCYEIQFSKFWM